MLQFTHKEEINHKILQLIKISKIETKDLKMIETNLQRTLIASAYQESGAADFEEDKKSKERRDLLLVKNRIPITSLSNTENISEEKEIIHSTISHKQASSKRAFDLIQEPSSDISSPLNGESIPPKKICITKLNYREKDLSSHSRSTEPDLIYNENKPNHLGSSLELETQNSFTQINPEELEKLKEKLLKENDLGKRLLIWEEKWSSLNLGRGIMPRKCPVTNCERDTTIKNKIGDLKAHVERNHLDVPLIACKENGCTKGAFKSHNSYYKHRRFCIGFKKEKINITESQHQSLKEELKAFTDLKERREHFKRFWKNLGTNPITNEQKKKNPICPYPDCDASFTEDQYREKHYQTHHLKDITFFSCCGREYNHSRAISEHICKK
jgi:hypothetical protein